MVEDHFKIKMEDGNLPFHAGRFRFYPTFFRQIGLEVINPHDRKKKVGINPIYFECVPPGAEGDFSLLYVPFDLMSDPEAKVKTNIAEDFSMVAEALNYMFTIYGVGAKTSSGFGTTDSKFSGNGEFQIKAEIFKKRKNACG